MIEQAGQVLELIVGSLSAVCRMSDDTVSNHDQTCLKETDWLSAPTRQTPFCFQRTEAVDLLMNFVYSQPRIHIQLQARICYNKDCRLMSIDEHE